MSQEGIKPIRVLSKVDNKNTWINENPQLLDREVGYERESGKYKIGAYGEDGELMRWNDLPYAAFDVSENSKSFAAGSHAEGSKNVAGGRGYKILAQFQDSGTNGVYQLRTIEGLEIGMEYSIRTGFSKPKAGEIIQLNNVDNLVWVTNFQTVDLVDETKYPDDPDNFIARNYLMIVDHPELGDMEVGFNAHAEGEENIAHDLDTHVEGWNNKALAMFGHAEGRQNIVGYAAHAEGWNNEALGDASHAEGKDNKALGLGSNVSGTQNTTYEEAKYSHAEGFKAKAKGSYSHVEGESAASTGKASHAEGYGTNSIGDYSHAEGNRANSIGAYSHAEGGTNRSSTSVIYNNEEPVFEYDNGKLTDNSIETVVNTWDNTKFLASLGQHSHTEGYNTISVGSNTHAEGEETAAIGDDSHAEGYSNKTYGYASHIEGAKNNIHGSYSHSEGYNNTISGSSSHAEGNDNQITSDYSHAEGYNNQITRNVSHAEGCNNIASNLYTHVEGFGNTANGERSHAEGYGNTIEINGYASHIEGGVNVVSTKYSHAEGYSNEVHGNFGHAEGYNNTVSGQYAHAEGFGNTVSTDSSHVEGISNTVTGGRSHAEGSNTQALAYASHTEGEKTIASANWTHAEGYGSKASGKYSHAEGQGTLAKGENSHAEGYNTQANGTYSHAEGQGTLAQGINQHVQGKYNIKDEEDYYAFIIGNGTSDTSLGNAFRVTYAGGVFGKSSYNSTGADYAEYFEWADGNPNNEDRRGLFVTMDGDKIKIASSEDEYILGIVSGQPCIIGNADECWYGRYLLDDFGSFIEEEYEYEEEITTSHWDEENKKEVFEKSYITKTGVRFKENPDYDPNREYISRADRKEWSAIGMVGVLSVIDDGTCQVNGYCKVAEDGTATAALTGGYRVIKRINDHIVKVIFK